MDNQKKDFKSGFVSLLGRTNVGKSTFLNAILNKKVSIVTPKIQTTRNQIRGILNDTNKQIIFVDTPGIHKSEHELGKNMNSSSLQSLKSSDIILFFAPLNEHIGESDNFLLKILKEKKIPTILLLTKSDLVNNKIILEKISEWKNRYEFNEIIPISSDHKESLQKVIVALEKILPEGVKYYPDDTYSDQPEKFLIREIIREKIIMLTKEEVPYSVGVMVESQEDLPEENTIIISASIIVERKSQKIILVGKNGNMIKKITYQSRKELSNLLNTKIILNLFVKVEEKWRNKSSVLKKLGYNKESY
ncbi:GTPase Era [Spiroplasma endosymbiont of Amphibalanus improvisus]|uniref:GTPase Era n=1 Tax=Spiroplasma endosymbiont of Amphibalanus improvisus TaxID=3066327 RepID=UPI00313C8856